MTALPHVSNKDARALFLNRHGLAEASSGQGNGRDLQRLVDQLGFAQIDSINTVARAHHMILHTRQPAYRPKNIHLLHDRDRGVFEHWTHDASMISMQHFPHWKLKFRRHVERAAKRGRDDPGLAGKLEDVLSQISERGPCCSADVGEGEARSSGGWWEWNPSKVALERLWRTGRLSVLRRDAFRKVYDLTENVIPTEVLNVSYTEAETIDWACRSALDRLGFATSGELAAFWDLISAAEARAWCRAALDDGALIEAEIVCVDGSLRKSYMWPDTLEEVSPAPTSRMRIMSPFDPALRDRKRAERLFGFSYRIEVFVPEAKRQYGYYVFPVLEGDRLVARIDMKAERDRDRLHVRALWPEAKVAIGVGRRAKLESALARTARVADVSDVTFEDGWLGNT